MSPFFKGGFKSDNLFKDKLLALSLLLAIYHEFICEIKEIEERSGDRGRHNKRIYFPLSGKVKVAPNQPMTVTIGMRERIREK